MVCYNCDRPSHYSSDCRAPPEAEKKSSTKDEGYYKAKYLELKAKKEKSFVVEEADWAESSDEDDEEVKANLCLMASADESRRISGSY